MFPNMAGTMFLINTRSLLTLTSEPHQKKKQKYFSGAGGAEEYGWQEFDQLTLEDEDKSVKLTNCQRIKGVPYNI